MDNRLQKRPSAECDALHYGMNWDPVDWEKPQVVVENTFGDSHPGSSHLNELSREAEMGIWESGGRPARYTVTDMCDGVCQGTRGMSYSLLMRDFMAAMVEIQMVTRPVDGIVFISSCDKSVPAHLVAAARLKLPSVFLPGGTMSAGAEFLCTDRLWEQERQYELGVLSSEELLAQQLVTCPSPGACQGMGTATTMQIMTEALGLASPGSAIIPATNNAIKRAARETGRIITNLIKKRIGIQDIVTRNSFENAITLHAAIQGSANAILHLLAMAKEIDLDIDVNLFDKIHRRVPVLTNIQPIGAYPSEWLWYAGGIPAVMLQLRDLLHLDCLTVTGKTLGENLDLWQRSFNPKWQQKFLDNVGVNSQDIIRPRDKPLSENGSTAILKGNLCPGGAVIKHSALVPAMLKHTGRAKVFETEDEALNALSNNEIKPGEIIVVRYQGPKAAGMPEMFRISDAIACRKEFAKSTAVITDGRYSGYTRAPAIGYLSPEAYAGGMLALVEDADIIALSALLTTTLIGQKDVIEALEGQGKREKYKVLLGGGAVTKAWADEIGADGYAENGYGAVKLVKSFIA
jgi:dihydroxy-acid dehydratase